MAQSDSQHDNQPITLEQKLTLIKTYERTGNMSLAMREADIRSPRTAYLWWRRYCADKEAGLQPRSHARHTQTRLDKAVVEQICALRQKEPSWGRRRIANELAERSDGLVVSPAAVEATLRRHGLWHQPTHAPSYTPQAADWLRNGVDNEQLLLIVQEGIHLSLQSQVSAANNVLYQQVWRHLESNPSLLRQLLVTTQFGLGSWLFASRLALGHSLMNSGQWYQTARILRETLDWIEACPVEPRQCDATDEVHEISLRRDDIWLGCTHHLGLMLAKQNQVEAGIGYLQTALGAIHRAHRAVKPTDSTESGSLDRDLAHLKLRLRRPPKAEIHRHLVQAQQSAEDAGSFAVQAFTQFAWAKLFDRLARETDDREKSTRQQQRNEMERAIYSALAFVEAEPSDRPMRLTLCYIDAAQLSQAHNMPVEKDWVQRAAEYCITYGYRGQAQQLLTIPGVHTWLSEETLRNLANSSRPG